MKKQYFKIKDGNRITITTESIQSILFQTGLVFLIFTGGPSVLSIGHDLTFGAYCFIFVGNILSLLIFLSSFLFKPVYTVFNKDTGFVSFHSEKINFEVPFSQIQFVYNRIPTGRGISSIMVSVYAISNKPLFPNQKIINERKPFSHYETLLCTYRCSSKDQAENSIEQLQRFMGALPPEVEGASKFDSLLE